MRVGLLGGTFDPIHNGHLDVAAAARTALALDEVRVLPSALPPHRRAPVASVAHRLAMARIAVGNLTGYSVSDAEAASGGATQSPRPSYTTDTLDRLDRAGLDLRTVFFITGADAFRDIATWKGYPALLDRCHFVVVSRPGCSAGSMRSALPELAGRMADAKAVLPDRPTVILVDATTAPVSSTIVRERLGRGESIEGLVPPGVASYIDRQGLYRNPGV